MLTPEELRARPIGYFGWKGLRGFVPKGLHLVNQKFTCFTSTKVQILTLMRLPDVKGRRLGGLGSTLEDVNYKDRKRIPYSGSDDPDPK